MSFLVPILGAGIPMSCMEIKVLACYDCAIFGVEEEEEEEVKSRFQALWSGEGLGVQIWAVSPE